MGVRDRLQEGYLLSAALDGQRAAGNEGAALGNVERTGQIALDALHVPGAQRRRVGNRPRAQETLGVGVPGTGKERLAGRGLNQAAEIEHRHTVGDPTLAAANGISSSYLYKLFKPTGQSVGEWIIRRRLDLCRDRLCDQQYQDQSITEIAFDLGFNNLSHFSTRFRQAFGCSPREFRRSEADRELTPQRR